MLEENLKQQKGGGEMNTPIKLLRNITFAYVLSSSVLFFSSCKDNSVTPSGAGNVELSQVRASETGDNANVIVFSEVKMLAKHIKLTLVNSRDDEKELKIGPVVLYIVTPVTSIVTETIPVGLYEKVQFHIHKPRGNEVPPDHEFVDSEGRWSVIVKGTFNDMPFAYKSAVNAVQKIRIPEPVAVAVDQTTNVTIKVSPWMWFTDESGQLMDPTDPANRHEIDHNIKENIKEGFRAFRDDNKDGEPD